MHNMMTTNIYLFHQRHKVILLDTTGDYFTRRFRQVYTRDLIAHRGTDNQILIQFLNQDQKRVELTRYVATGDPVDADALVPGQEYCIDTVGDTDWTTVGTNACYQEGTKFIATDVAATTAAIGTATPIESADLEFTCRLISHDGEKLILEKPLVVINRTAGQTKLVLTEEELDLIMPGEVGFSIEQTANGVLYEPVYVDDNSGGRGQIKIVDSIMPAFIASDTITIPAQTIPGPSYESSVLNTNEEYFHTFQFDLDQFTGDINVLGAADTDGLWYTIQTESISASDLHVFNVEGYHPYIKFVIPQDLPAANLVVGGEYEITWVGTTDFTLIGAAANTIGEVFTATAAGIGDGTAKATAPGSITKVQHR